MMSMFNEKIQRGDMMQGFNEKSDLADNDETIKIEIEDSNDAQIENKNETKNDLMEEKTMENDLNIKNVVNDYNDEKLANIGVEDEEMDLFFILDRSGSMYGSENDTINGFNAFVEKQAAKNHNILVTVVLFDGKYEVLYARKPISEVKPLTSKEYYVRGSTALLDAIGRTVNTYRGEVNHAMCIITTDGYENSSREFNRDQIKDMVENSGWEFVYIGADIDAYAEASHIGIRQSRIARHRKSAKGYDDMYNAVGEITNKFYIERENLNKDFADWKEDLE